jgi:hypothetical protein
MSGFPFPWAVASASAPWILALVVAGAVAWQFHVRRLRARERALLALVEAHARGWSNGGNDRPGGSRSLAAGLDAEPDFERALILVVAPPGRREDAATRLEGLDMDVSLADSIWSADAACRDAFEAGRPYNLVLLDAALPEMASPGRLDLIQSTLGPWGVRVGLMRPRDVRTPGRRMDVPLAPPGAYVGEGTGSDENPDCRGRSRFEAPAPADAAEMGLRSRRRE